MILNLKFYITNINAMHILDRIARIKTMRFECDPRIIGRFYVAYSVLTTIMLATTAVLMGEEMHFIDIVALVVLTVPLTLLGLYFWFVRRKLARHEIEIGTWSDDLYHRSRTLYVLYKCVRNAVYVGGFLAVLYLLRKHTDTAEAETDMAYWRILVLLSFWAGLFEVVNDVINRNAFYHNSINVYEYDGLNYSFSWRSLWDDIKREWHF